MPPRLEAFDFESLAGWTGDDHLAALRTFERSARALVAGRDGPRPASPPSPGLIANAHAALGAIITVERDARRFFETRFRPFRVIPENGRGFLTGYYEPCVAASRVQTEEFRWPILGRPADLVTFAPGQTPIGFPEGISGARRLSDGSLVPYDDRAAIEQGAPRSARLASRRRRGFPCSGTGLCASRICRRTPRAPRLRRPQRPALYVDWAGFDRGGRDRRKRHVAREPEGLAAERAREGIGADAAQSLVRVLQAHRGFRSRSRSGRRRRRGAHDRCARSPSTARFGPMACRSGSTPNCRGRRKRRARSAG